MFIQCSKREMTYKQQEQFVEFYRWLYGDTSIETGTWQIPTIFKDEEELHRNMWLLALEKILGKTKFNKKYYPNQLTKLKRWEYVFEWLRMGYWPRVLDYDLTVNARDWWIA
jgi:hypothetical protein